MPGIGWGSGKWKTCTKLNQGKKCNNPRHVHKQHWLRNTWYYMVLPPEKNNDKKK
jgi:hypothetical protein